VATALTPLLLSGAALWVVPRLISRSALETPSRVPKEWVAEYDPDNQ
jgi:hypothetical protein